MEDWKVGDDCCIIHFGYILNGKIKEFLPHNYLKIVFEDEGGAKEPFESFNVHRTKRKCVEELLERRKFAYEIEILKIKKEFPKEYKNILASKRVKNILK